MHVKFYGGGKATSGRLRILEYDTLRRRLKLSLEIIKWNHWNSILNKTSQTNNQIRFILRENRQITEKPITINKVNYVGECGKWFWQEYLKVEINVKPWQKTVEDDEAPKLADNVGGGCVYPIRKTHSHKGKGSPGGKHRHAVLKTGPLVAMVRWWFADASQNSYTSIIFRTPRGTLLAAFNISSSDSLLLNHL